MKRPIYLCAQTFVIGLLLASPLIAAKGGGKGGGGGPGGGGIDNPALVFSHTDGRLYLTTADGGTTVALTKPKGQATTGAGSWSPDGSQIAFQYNPGNDSRQIRTINPDGSGETTVTVLGPDDPQPGDAGTGGKLTLEWSPNASEILFASLGTIDDPQGVYAVDLTNGSYAPLISGAALGAVFGPEDSFESFGDPALSPDLDSVTVGYQGLLAFHAAYRDIDPLGGPDLDYIWDIWTVDATIDSDGLLQVDLGTVTRLTSAPGHRYHSVFSPSGQFLAYIEDHDHDSFLTVMDMVTGVSIPVAIGYTREPTWSPDEAEIAISAPRSVGNLQTTYDIFRIAWMVTPPAVINVTNTDGQNEREVAPDWNPAWTPAE